MHKILFVDDNELNREVLSDMLDILFDNINVEVYEHANDVLALDTNKYDLILSDIDMPDISGFELYTKLRDEKKYQNPIIALTALAVSGDKDKILLHGFNDYISKPIDMDELEDIVGKYLQ